jgi:hypothetical protein
LNNKKQYFGAESEAKAVKHLPHKYEALSSNPTKAINK